MSKNAIKEFGYLVEEFGRLAKNKGFDKDEVIKPICIISCSEQMEDNFGDEIKAMKQIIELCKKTENGEKLLQEVLSLAGIE